MPIPCTVAGLNRGNTMNVFVSGQQLECALLSCASNDIRYYLNGAYVEFSRDSTRVVTTNGHHMFIMDQKPYEANEWSGSFIIPREVLEQLKPKTNRKGQRHSEAHYCITIEERITEGGTRLLPKLTIREVADKLELTFTEVEGKFPDYTRIIPRTDLYDQIAPSADFNIEYLMLALKLYRVLNSAKAVTVPLRNVVNEIGAVRLSGDAWFFIMPIRKDSVGNFGSMDEVNKFRARIEVFEQKPLTTNEVEAN